MRPHIALAITILLLVAAPAHAAPATPYLRIEGAQTTLFEGPLRADGHAVRAANDTRDRACGSAGPTPTSLASDAMRLAGMDFAGTWFAGYSDYLVTRFGPDSEGSGGAWSLRVDGTLTVRGGCQIALTDSNEALWALSSSATQPYLKLTGATTAAPNAPVTLTVRDYAGTPAAGATVAAVTTAANGVQTPAATGPPTGADGTATLTFTTPGWHRVKATKAGAVRSNRVDICVGECGAPPADAQVRDVVPALPVPTPTPTPQPAQPTQPEPQPPFSTPTLALEGSKLQLRSVDPRQTGWTVTATPLGIKNAKPLTRTTETFSVPTGREYAFTFENSTSLGTLIVPIDDRAKAIRYRGKTKRTSTATRLSKNATATVRLGAGRPILLLAAGSRGKVEIADRSYTAKRGTLRARARAKTGTVTIKVRSGTLNLAGVAAGG